MAPKKSVYFSFIDEEDFVGSHVEVNTVSSGGDDDEVGYVSEVSSRDSQGRSYSAFLDFGLAERHISELTFDDLLLCFNALKLLRLISPLMVFDDRFIGPGKP